MEYTHFVVAGIVMAAYDQASDSRRCKLLAAVGECQSQLRQYQWFCLHRADIDNPLVNN
jgi:hypothetical protein